MGAIIDIIEAHPVPFTNVKELTGITTENMYAILTDIAREPVGTRVTGYRVLAFMAFGYTLSKEMDNIEDSEMVIQTVELVLDNRAPGWRELTVTTGNRWTDEDRENTARATMLTTIGLGIAAIATWAWTSG